LADGGEGMKLEAKSKTEARKACSPKNGDSYGQFMVCTFEHYPVINPLTPELNPSAQYTLTRFFTGDFASLTVHFVNICVKNQQMH
jgi:hypothetical protein